MTDLAIAAPSGSRVGQFFRFFRNGEHLWGPLEQQATALRREATACSPGANADDDRVALASSDAEREQLSLAFETALRSTWFLPIDREDLHELSSALDEVLVRTTHTRHALVILDVDPAAACLAPLGDLLALATSKIDTAIRHLRHKEYAVVTELARELRRLIQSAELAHHEALSSLLDRDDSMAAHHIVRHKTALEHQMRAIRECRTTATLLAFLAAKNG
ncbi:MAG: Phosphate transport regulator [Labilithrix sp.]|nr:Phosphate transport regulator [Labilithrix sp.]